MTCILGLEYNGKVYMGGDSMAADGWNMNPSSLAKVFKKGNFLFGYAGSYRLGNLLQFVFEPPVGVFTSSLEYLVKYFIPELQKCLKDNGYSQIENNVEKMDCFLLGYAGKLWWIQSDFQVNHSLYGMQAIGCGSQYALGAISQYFEYFKHSEYVPIPNDAIQQALETAAKFSNGVCGPFILESI